ncbi:hypothetical protein [Niallia sp. 03133]|uniref:hypothetical protein n=1 Tax=Niallia sp. 03133 TaxID=3458060 RepID=UPI0040450C5F
MGKNFYNIGGNVYNLADTQDGDITDNFCFGRKYNDFEFSQAYQLTYAASVTRGIDVYEYGTNKFLYSLRKDLNVQKMLYQKGMLITINKDSSGNNFIETIKADTPPSKGLPSTQGMPDKAGTMNNLGFKPNDVALDPNKPVIYMTRLGSKTIYAVNMSTGAIKALALPYPAERLELYNNKLYVTQQEMSHTLSSSNLVGAITEVDTESFKATKLIEVDTDPFDIAIDENGFVYISPGSGSWSTMKVYSLKTGGEISNSYVANMRRGSYIYYNQESSKVYSITPPLTSPMGVSAYEVDNGIIKSQYDSPYHGDYPIEPSLKISPDGLSIVNNSGVVFDSAKYRSGDMIYTYHLGRKYNDYAFNEKNGLTFAARKDNGIDVYQYNTNKYLYTIRKDLRVQNVFYQNGYLMDIGTDRNGSSYAALIDASIKGIQDPPGSSEPIAFTKEISVSKTGEAALTFNSKIPVNSSFAFYFNQFIEVDPDQIELAGPTGKVKFNSVVKEKALSIYPEYLQPSTTYTLTIKQEAIYGEVSQNLQNVQVYQFTTGSNWVNYDGIWHYYDQATGKFSTSWKVISKSQYYFNKDREMQKGWQTISSKKYYFNTKGMMQTSWQTISSKKYYFDTKGIMQTGWEKISGKQYYFNTSGIMQTGWEKISGKQYYFNTSGIMQTGWEKISGKQYYFNTSGIMQTGWEKISGKQYYFNTSGIMQTGWGKISGKQYYFNTSGIMQTGWEKISGKQYYFNTSGIMQTGWQKINGNKYYFNTIGIMLTGKQKIDGKYYYFSQKGILNG